MTPSELATLLRRASVLLLDFDGPVCSIFAGRPAAHLARELIDALRTDGYQLPEHAEALTDPFDALRLAGTLGPMAAARTDARLRAAELEAVPVARPTPHAAELIREWRDAGRRIAIVSNNSEAAVTEYAAARGLDLDAIVGRTSPEPALLKPDPHLVVRALEALAVDADAAVFVGDSPSDIAAGRLVGVVTIGYANKPGKRERLARAGASIVVDDIEALTLRRTTEST